MMFKIGDSVSVKPGVTDYDKEAFDIGGWQGRISEVADHDEETGEQLYCIDWDSITLMNMPPKYIEDSLEDGLDFTSIYLGENDIMPANPRDTEQDVERVTEEFEEKYYWAEFGEQGKRIKAVEDSSEDEDLVLDAWFHYLKANLVLPVKVVCQIDSSDEIQSGMVVNLTRITECDDEYGVIGEGTSHNGEISLPLSIVRPESLSPSNQALDDYVTWFVNC